MKDKRRAGITLIELLLAAAIFAIIASAVISVLAAGLRVYKRVQFYGSARADAFLSLEKMERDLRNVLNYSKIDFEGRRGEVSFAGMVNGTVGRIYYYRDARKEALIREEQGYSDGTAKIKKKKGRAAALASIKEMNFRYYYFNKESGKYEWKDTWLRKRSDMDDEEQAKEEAKAERVPLGVKIEVRFEDDKREVTLARSVFIPTAVRGER